MASFDPKNRPGSQGQLILDLQKEVQAVDERVTAVEATPVGSGGFPPIAARGDWNPQAAVAGCSYVFTCSCGAGKQLQLPVAPNDGDEVGFLGRCGFAGQVHICGCNTDIETPGTAIPTTTAHLQTSIAGAIMLRYNASRDLWETVQGGENDFINI